MCGSCGCDPDPAPLQLQLAEPLLQRNNQEAALLRQQFAADLGAALAHPHAADGLGDRVVKEAFAGEFDIARLRPKRLFSTAKGGVPRLPLAGLQSILRVDLHQDAFLDERLERVLDAPPEGTRVDGQV